MSSRRPMTRAFSANGRLGSINEDDMPPPSGRPDSRNYLLNVRPENRSTLCSVMAQLTEETQPSFDTTLKSKAVSEDSNVKFSCEVSGYPVPELTWYKDDMEIDRYCGLPKYEVFRNGKVHTLHIYNCTIEDAAIYQVSAKNSKGIVSCSGVLEVGDMNEFKIHQQFFNKLKQKADNKRKELAESRRRERGKENVQATVPEQPHALTPERPPRKRRSPSEPGLQAPPVPRDGEPEAKAHTQAEARLHDGAREEGTEQPAAAVEIPNGFRADARVTEGEQENGNQDLTYIYEMVEIVTTTRRPTKEPSATKRPKISNGVAGGEVSSGTVQAHESKKDEGEEGGMSLAQYLVESLKSQECENKEDSEQEVMEVDVSVSPEKEKVTQTAPLEEVNSDAQEPASKQPEPPNSQSSLSSVFFSIRDMFFGSKNDDAIRTADDAPQQNHVTAVDNEPPSDSFQLDSKTHGRELDSQAEDCKTPVGEIIEMDTEEQVEPPSGGESLRSASPLHITTREVQGDAAIEEWPGLDSHKQGDTISTSPSPVVEEPGEMARVAAHHLPRPGGGQMQEEEASGALEAPHIPAVALLSEVAEGHMQTERNLGSSVQDMVTPLRELNEVPGVFTSAAGQVTTDVGETDTLHDNDQTDPGEPPCSVQPHSRGSGEISMDTKADQQKLGPQNMRGPDGAAECKDSPTVNTDAVKEGDIHSKMNVVESEDGISQVNSSDFVEDSVEMREKESPLSTDQKMEVETMSEMQEKWRKDVTDTLITVQPMTVELKLPDVSQIEETMTVVPEVNIPLPRIPDALDTVTLNLTPSNPECIVPELPQEETVICIPKTYILESPTGPVNEKSGLQLLATLDIASVESDPASIIENVRKQEVLSSQEDSQQDQEQTVDKTAQKNIDKTEKETSIPVINVCLSEDSVLWFDPEPHKVKYPTEIKPAEEESSKVPTFIVPPISVISSDSPPWSNNISEDRVNEIESTSPLVSGVNTDVDLKKRCESPSLVAKEDISPPASVCEKITDVKESAEPLVIGVPPETIVFSQSDTTYMASSVPDTLMNKTTPQISCLDPEKPQKESRTTVEPQSLVDQLQKDSSTTEKLSLAGPEQPMLSPTTLRRFAAKGLSGLEAPVLMAVPAIQVYNFPSGEEQTEEVTGGESPPAIPSCETSPRLRRKDSPTLIPSATPEELASGARRKIFLAKSKGEVSEGAEKEELQKRRTLSQEQEQPYMSPSQSRKSAFLQPSTRQQTPPTERRSPHLNRKKATLEVPKRPEELVEVTVSTKTDDKPAEKEILNPFKAPQVIRKIRGEPFPDAVGHLKLWCQFFNVLSDSTIKWYRDDVKIAEVKRSAGDESQVALAIVQTSSRDCGVYTCSMKNEYGTDTTDFLLSAEILSNFLLREDLEVGEEIEMTPMIFAKGLADPGYWGDKFFGRIMIQEAHIGEGCAHKACRVKVIYGLEPVIESGSSCIIKARNPIAYSCKDDISLAEINLEITKNECKIQNTVREYCKVFAAEARAIENFGTALEMHPRYLMYRPANTVPYATVEVDVPGVFQKYCTMDATGRLIMRSATEVEQKCCTFQHWIHQWTNGNLLVTQLEGIGMRITNIGIATKLKGYQGLPDSWNPQVFEQFVVQHQCNYYCGLLGLRTLKPMDSLQQPAKIKGSRSPLLNRRAGPSSSPQLPKKGVHSPQSTRKAASSPKVTRKSESGDNGKTTAKPKTAAEGPKAVGTR